MVQGSIQYLSKKIGHISLVVCCKKYIGTPLNFQGFCTGHSTIRATQVVRITVRPARVLVCILDKIYIIY